MNLNEFEKVKESFLDAKARKNLLEEQLLDLESEYQIQHNRSEHGEKARLIFQAVAKITQKNLEFHISKLVTTALSSVFPDNIEFVVRIENRRNKTECDLLFKEFGEEYKPLEGSGFGPIDVATFALRIAFWSLNKNRATLILDEPFRHLSFDLQTKASEMIKMISEKLNMQIIMISHQVGIDESADKMFVVEKQGMISKVKELN